MRSLPIYPFFPYFGGEPFLMKAVGDPLSFACPHCKFSIRFKPELAGRRGNCPQCKQILEVPRSVTPGTQKPKRSAANAETVVIPKRTTATIRTAVASAAAAPARTPSPTPADPRLAVLSAFKGPIAPVETLPAYNVGICLAAGVMVFLAMTYVGIIIAATYLTYYHAVYNVGLLEHLGDRGRSAKSFWMFFAYLIPLVFEIVLVFFLLKPLFAKRFVSDKPRSLRRQDEPYLFAFVDRICQCVNAPVPSRIDVDCQVNAAAGFRRGVWSMFTDDMVLVIGLPLVAGLSLQQFAGVLAHEFGHFSQGTAMRVSYLVRSISMWFTRLVYERDAWDERLRIWAAGDGGISFIAIVAICCIWITRRVLWCLMMLGHLVSSYLLRQMEFDADKYEARLAGSNTFASTQRQMRVLNIATQGAYADLNEFMKEGRLGDNLPLLIQSKVKQLPADVLAKIHASASELTTSLFDTHPADNERIESAQEEQAPGVFHRTEPASTLFANFAALSKTCTWDFYRGIFGDSFKLTDMHSVNDLLARQDAEGLTYKSLHRYFQGTFGTLRPISFPSAWSEAPKAPKDTLALVKRLREELLAAADRVKNLAEQYRTANDLVFEADQAKALIHAKQKFKPAEYHLQAATYEAAKEARDTASFKMSRLSPAIETIADHNGRRLFAALQLMHVPQVAAKLPEAKLWQEQVNDLLHVAQLVGRQVTNLVGLRNAFASLSVLLGRVESNRENQIFIEAVVSSMKSNWEIIAQIREPLTRATYPFDHAHGEMMLSMFVLPDMPHREDLGGIYNAADRVLDRLPALYAKVCARLAWMGEQIEQAVGLPPLPEPVEKPSEESARNTTAV